MDVHVLKWELTQLRGKCERLEAYVTRLQDDNKRLADRIVVASKMKGGVTHQSQFGAAPYVCACCGEECRKKERDLLKWEEELRSLSVDLNAQKEAFYAEQLNRKEEYLRREHDIHEREIELERRERESMARLTKFRNQLDTDRSTLMQIIQRRKVIPRAWMSPEEALFTTQTLTRLESEQLHLKNLKRLLKVGSKDSVHRRLRTEDICAECVYMNPPPCRYCRPPSPDPPVPLTRSTGAASSEPCCCWSAMPTHFAKHHRSRHHHESHHQHHSGHSRSPCRPPSCSCHGCDPSVCETQPSDPAAMPTGYAPPPPTACYEAHNKAQPAEAEAVLVPQRVKKDQGEKHHRHHHKHHHSEHRQPPPLSENQSRPEDSRHKPVINSAPNQVVAYPASDQLISKGGAAVEGNFEAHALNSAKAQAAHRLSNPEVSITSDSAALQRPKTPEQKSVFNPTVEVTSGSLSLSTSVQDSERPLEAETTIFSSTLNASEMQPPLPPTSTTGERVPSHQTQALPQEPETQPVIMQQPTDDYSEDAEESAPKPSFDEDSIPEIAAEETTLEESVAENETEQRMDPESGRVTPPLAADDELPTAKNKQEGPDKSTAAQETQATPTPAETTLTESKDHDFDSSDSKETPASTPRRRSSTPPTPPRQESPTPPRPASPSPSPPQKSPASTPKDRSRTPSPPRDMEKRRSISPVGESPRQPSRSPSPVPVRQRSRSKSNSSSASSSVAKRRRSSSSSSNSSAAKGGAQKKVDLHDIDSSDSDFKMSDDDNDDGGEPSSGGGILSRLLKAKPTSPLTAPPPVTAGQPSKEAKPKDEVDSDSEQENKSPAKPAAGNKEDDDDFF